MRPIEKINLIKNLLEALSKFTNFEQETFLDYCQIKCQTNSWNDDWWIDLQPTLYNTKDSSKLIKLAQELEISPNLAMISKHYPHNWENDSNLKAFISHSSKFKDSAHRLKDALNFHKISGFVAHDDVVPSTEWQDQIEKGLNTMDFFISIHTEEYEKSIWCQQELGFAIARKVDIFPITTTKDNLKFLPQGFANKFQAMKAVSAEELAKQIAEHVRNSKKIGELYNQINPILTKDIDDDIPF